MTSCQEEINGWNDATERSITKLGQQSLGHAKVHYDSAVYFDRLRNVHAITNIIERILEGLIKIISICILIMPAEWFSIGDIEGIVVKTVILVALTFFDLFLDLIMGICNIIQEAFAPSTKCTDHKMAGSAYITMAMNINNEYNYTKDKRAEAKPYSIAVINKFTGLVERSRDPPSHIKLRYKEYVTRINRLNNTDIPLPIYVTDLTKDLLEFDAMTKRMSDTIVKNDELQEIVLKLDRRYAVTTNNDKEKGPEIRTETNEQDERTRRAINGI